MRIRYAENEDVSELKNIWKICFGDTDEYINSFFDSLFKQQNTVIAEINERVAGVVYMIPAKLKETDFMYGYAIGVLPEFRGQSVCKKMLDFIKKASEEEKFIFGLHPANEKLEQFYQKIGLKPMYSLKEVVIKEDLPYTDCKISDISAEEIINIRENTFPDLVEWDKNVIDFIQKNGESVKKITLHQKMAYFFIRKERDTLIIFETSADDEYIRTANEYLKKKYDVKNVKYTLSSKTYLQGDEKTCIYGFSEKDDNVYMNLFLE